MAIDYEKKALMDASGFVLLSDFVPDVIQEIRYHSTYNFIGDRIAGYVASKSSHSRGSTIDLTLVDMETGKEVDMGSPFDMFSEVSHPDYRGITDRQYENRMTLQRVMVRNGFVPIDCEWWHFTLEDEPFPETYFEFPVSSDSLRRS